MDSTPLRPRHLSYLAHRRQATWQIILPVALAGLLLIGVVVLVWLATFGGDGDVSRWAAISTIWLVLPVMLGGLLILIALVGVTYLLGRAAGFIPRYTYQAQLFAARIEAGVREAAEVARKPRRMLGEIGGLLKRALKLTAGQALKRLRKT